MRVTGGLTISMHLPPCAECLLLGRKRAAAIGVGGGRDPSSAWTFGLRNITGVEIKPIFIKLLNRMTDSAGLNKLGGIVFILDEERIWFARTDQCFDTFVMSLVDTRAAAIAGAFSLSGNGLNPEFPG